MGWDQPKSVLFFLMMVIALGLSEGADDCPNCEDERLSPEELRELRLEYIKVQILSKLRMTNPPNIVAPALPELLNYELLSDSEDEDLEEDFSRENYFGQTREVIIFSNSSELNDCPSQLAERCFQLHLTPEVSMRSIKSAELWVKGNSLSQVNNTTTYEIFDVQFNEDSDSINKTSIANATSAGHILLDWLRFNLTSVVRSWVQNGPLQRNLELVCNDCNPFPTMEDGAIFLRIRVDLENLDFPRRKREEICSVNSTICCKEIFNVSFEEIGWHRWIFKPDSYNANFCRGSCNSDISSARYFHTSVIRGFLLSPAAIGRSFTPSLCCSPYKMKSLTIIYMTEDRFIYKKTLPNMIAESCDCV